MTDEAKTARALAVCDEFAAQWAEEVNLTEMVAAIANKDDAEGRIIALAKQSFIEGMYRAVTEQQDQAVVVTDEAKRLAEIRERAEMTKEVLATCESCGKQLVKGDQYFSYDDGPDFCGDHAPTISDVLSNNKEVAEMGNLDDEDMIDVLNSIISMQDRLLAGESADTKVTNTL